MNDEELDQMLRAIPDGAQAALPALDDGVLLAYRAGRLSAEQTQAVEERLAKDPEARALLEALSEELGPADVDAVLARLPAAANVIPLRRRPATWAAVAALAAGLVAVVVTRPATEQARYLLEVEGGEAPTRGATPAQRLMVGPEGRLTVRLRAEEATDAHRVLGVFVEGDAGRLSRVTPASLASAHGSFELRLEGGAFSVGEHRLWLVVASDDDVLSRLAGRTHEAARGEGLGWWALQVERRGE